MSQYSNDATPRKLPRYNLPPGASGKFVVSEEITHCQYAEHMMKGINDKAMDQLARP